MQKIFIVEDDDNIKDMVLYALTSAGFLAEGFSDGEKMWEGMIAGRPSLLLLDIMLPGEDGLCILKKLRQSTKFATLPVIMLTAKGAEYDRIKGLDLGADDYITKPFSILEVISRIRAVLRRYEKDEDIVKEVKIGEIILHPEQRSVFADREEILLTYREFELLYYLMLNTGIVLSRDKLLEQVWGFDYNGESRTVDMHIKSLRQKIGRHSYIIKTIRNVGYKVEA